MTRFVQIPNPDSPAYESFDADRIVRIVCSQHQAGPLWRVDVTTDIIQPDEAPLKVCWIRAGKMSALALAALLEGPT